MQRARHQRSPKCLPYRFHTTLKIPIEINNAVFSFKCFFIEVLKDRLEPDNAKLIYVLLEISAVK